MSAWNQFRQRVREYLARKFRVILVNEETFVESKNYRLNNGQIILYLGATLLGIISLTTLLIFLTPIRELTPGYTDPSLVQKQVELLDKVKMLQAEVTSQQQYIQSLQRMSGLDPDSLVAQHSSSPPPAPVTQPAPAPPAPPQPAPAPPAPAQAPQTNSTATATPAKLVGTDQSHLNFRLPLDPKLARMVRKYNPAERHFAVDIAAPANTPVLAAASGYVFFADYTLQTGYVIGIYHANRTVTFYKHNSRNLKKVGSFVNAGEAVAIIGDTGENSTGAHLHFEIWHNGLTIDPLQFLPML
jgi:murein DD-endopeptidase MepM/ murein hydrolase activator NlpD